MEKLLTRLPAGFRIESNKFVMPCDDGMLVKLFKSDDGKIWICGRFYSEGHAQSCTWFPSFKQAADHLNSY